MGSAADSPKDPQGSAAPGATQSEITPKRHPDSVEESSTYTGPMALYGDAEPDTDAVRPDALASGAFIGPFRVVRELGRGGMGATYVAMRDDVEKRVCLKTILPHHAADPVYRDQFLTEARTVAKVSHPNVVSLIDFGQERSGELWAAYDLVDGSDLLALVKKTRKGCLAPELAALIATDLAAGLLHLHTPDHRRGTIVHRDLSRNNVMVSYDGVAILIDLGIARTMAGADTETDAKGKLQYMAPEALRGGAIGPAVDQWALGVVLYWLVSGRMPYRGAYDGHPPAALDSPYGPLDPRLAQIVSRLLAPEPERRYPSLGVMIDELAPLVPPPMMRRQLGKLVYAKAPPKSRPLMQAAADDDDADLAAPVASRRARRDVTSLEPGERLGEWTLDGKLGSGGMAVVYRAHRTSLGTQYAALKVIRQEHSESPEFVARFHDEARIALRLNHPTVVTVLDAGVVDGICYIAMELVEGCDLAALVETLGKRGILPGPRLPGYLVALIGYELARALAYAHGRGVVHRDVSPHNEMATVEGALKLNDWGVAKATQADGMATKTQHAIGKPFYMPPEQFRGDALDGRADLFAVGVSLFELLVGATPYAMRGAPNETVHMVVKRIFENDRPHVAEVAGDAPPALIDAIERLLQPDRERRMRSADELMHALEPLVQLQATRHLAELVRASKDASYTPSPTLLEGLRAGAPVPASAPQSTPQMLTAPLAAMPADAALPAVAVPAVAAPQPRGAWRPIERVLLGAGLLVLVLAGIGTGILLASGTGAREDGENARDDRTDDSTASSATDRQSDATDRETAATAERPTVEPPAAASPLPADQAATEVAGVGATATPAATPPVEPSARPADVTPPEGQASPAPPAVAEPHATDRPSHARVPPRTVHHTLTPTPFPTPTAPPPASRRNSGGAFSGHGGLGL